MAPLADKKQVVLETTMNVAHPVRLGDAMRFHQIIHNLVSNAIKFTPSGTVKVTISDNLDTNKDLVRVDVHDTGIGIAQEHVSLLFEVRASATPSAEM